MRSDRRSSGSLYPADTSLLLRVEVPASGFNVFLSFAVKPGLPLEQVQQGVTEVIDELGYRLGSFLNEKDLQSNADKYEVAKLECEQQLQDWQSRLSEATLAVLRADRSRSELSKLRESYWREVQNLRQQLYRKERAEESGKDFVPASVDLFSSKEAGSGFNDLILEQMNRMEDEHQAEIASWKQKNAKLLRKMKSKVRGIELATCDVDVQTEIDAKEVSCGTEVVSVMTSQSCGFEGVSFNNFVDVMTFPIRDGETRDEDLSRPVGATVATVSVDSEMQTDSVWQDLELEDFPKGQTGEMKVRTSTEMTDSYQEVESDESDESLPSDDESLERKEKPNFQEILSEQDPIVMDDETQSDVEGVPVETETEPVAPTLLGVSRTPTSPPARSPRWSRFHRPHLQIKTSLDDEAFQMPKQETGSNGSNGDRGSNGSTANSKGKDRIFVTSDEKTTHLITPKANQSPISSSRSASASKKTKLPGLRVEKVEKDLHDSSTSRSPPLRRSSVTCPTPDEKDTKDTKELTFPVCSLGSVCRVESAMTRPSQRIISRPRLLSRRHSTRD